MLKILLFRYLLSSDLVLLMLTPYTSLRTDWYTKLGSLIILSQFLSIISLPLLDDSCFIASNGFSSISSSLRKHSLCHPATLSLCWLIEAFYISSVIWFKIILQYFESWFLLKLWLFRILNTDNLLKSILLICARVISFLLLMLSISSKNFQTQPLQLVHLDLVLVSYYAFLTLKIITFSIFDFYLLIILNMAW